jgi:hypothetical protein
VALPTGKDTKHDFPLITADTSKTAAIVLKLIEPLLKQGSNVWGDNFYNEPSLTKTLKIIIKMDCVGTMKLTQKNVIIKVKTQNKKKKKKKQNYGTAFCSCFCHKME